MAALHVLFGFLFTLAVASALGQLLLTRLRLKLFRQESLLLGYVLGTAVLSLAVFALGILHLAHRGVFFLFGLLAIAASFKWKPARSPAETPLPLAWKLIFLVPFACFTVLYFFAAMSPEMSPDGAAYHLGIVDQYYRAHAVIPIRTNMYASLSQGMEMLFLFAYIFGKHSAAAMVHFSFLAALSLLLLAWGRRFASPAVAVGAALLVYASPVAGVDGTSAYNDVATACVAFALFFALELWNLDRAPDWLLAIGILAGFCYALKYTAALAVPFAAGYVAVRARQSRWKSALIVGACSSLLILPWMIKDWIWVANPVAPFFNKLFPNPYVHILFETRYRDEMRHFGGLTNPLAIFWDLTVRGRHVDGIIGPVFLLAPLALLALRRPQGRALLVAFAVFFAPYFANLGARFVLPSVPFLAAALALALADLPIVLAVIVLFHALASWPSNVDAYATVGWKLEHFRMRPSLRIIPEDRWLSTRSRAYISARMIERHVPPGEKVLMLNQTAEAYTTREIWVQFQSGPGELLGDTLFCGYVADYLPTHIREFQFAQRALRAIRVVQTARNVDIWGMNELRVYNGDRELARDPRWRLRARPNPWEIQRAFDNNPATRWRAYQPIEPGQFVQIDFAGSQTASRVRIEADADQPDVRLRLEGLDESGRWSTLAATPHDSLIPPPPATRIAAAQAIKAQGFHYLCLYDDDFGGKEYWENRDQWGFTLIEEQAGARLYRIDVR